jgi:uncharacterized Ntn-hydrolase superfamily protein
MSRTESDPSLELLVEILDVGKAYTREAYQTLNKDSKWKLRRDLKKLGFLDLLNFVAERTSP